MSGGPGDKDACLVGESHEGLGGEQGDAQWQGGGANDAGEDFDDEDAGIGRGPEDVGYGAKDQGP